MTRRMMSELRAVGAAALAEALALLLPIACAGCDAPDVALCERCERALAPHPRRQVVRAAGGDLDVWSGLTFDDVPARVMRAVKEEGRIGLAPVLARSLTAVLVRLDAADAVVVPMPTSRAAYRRRGYRVPDLLARRAGLRPVRALRQVRRTRDQRGLDREERRRNTAGSMAARGVSGRRVVVVDDVVTTGASLAEAARALRAAGADVIAAATVAATPRRAGYDGERQKYIPGMRG